eukprot:364637-Chlamydomonas_euryale.AAC.2
MRSRVGGGRQARGLANKRSAKNVERMEWTDCIGVQSCFCNSAQLHNAASKNWHETRRKAWPGLTRCPA